MEDFTDQELLELFHTKGADLSLLSPAELGRLDKLTTDSPRSAAASGLPPAPHSDANPLSDSDPGGSSLVDRTSAMLDPLANPKGMGDMAGLLLPNFAGVGSALTNAAAPFVKGAGQALESAGQRMAPFLRRNRVATVIGLGPKATAAAAAVPPVLKGSGRILQRTGSAMEAAPITESMFKVDLGPAEAAVAKPPQKLLGAGAIQAPPPPDPSFVRGVPAELASVEKAPSVNVYSPNPETNRTLEGVATALGSENLRQPLGSPRVIAWKEGFGPTQADVQAARDFGGTKNAAYRLKIPQSQVRSMAPTTNAVGLPPEAQGRIRDAMQAMSPDEQAAYLAQAPNEHVRSFIQSMLSR